MPYLQVLPSFSSDDSSARLPSSVYVMFMQMISLDIVNVTVKNYEVMFTGPFRIYTPNKNQSVGLDAEKFCTRG